MFASTRPATPLRLFVFNPARPFYLRVFLPALPILSHNERRRAAKFARFRNCIRSPLHKAKKVVDSCSRNIKLFYSFKIFTKKVKSSSLSKRKKKKKQIMEKQCSEDRISALPDALIHHIFSILDMRVVVQTSILSNRWRYLWSSTPYLNFNYECLMCDSQECSCLSECDSCIEKQNGFMNFVDRVLILRGSSNIVKFNLTCDCKFRGLDTDHVYAWILASLRLKAQHLLLDVAIAKPMKLPHHLFTSNIMVLELKLSCKLSSPLPNSICTAARIKSLHLHNVIFPNGNSNREFNLSCPCLEKLRISNCDVSHLKILTISTSLLESLELCTIYTNTSSSCKVKIVTPNLKSLKVSASPYLEYFMVDYSIENLSSLLSADIAIVPYYTAGVYDGMKACTERLNKVLNGIYNVQALKLSVYSVEVIADAPELLESVPDLFQNLKYVALKGQLEVPYTNAVLKFLEKVPRIETLVWENQKSYWSLANGVNWVTDAPFQSIFNCLKTFKIRYFQGTEVEVKFLEFLLERAIVLKEMIIKKSGCSYLNKHLESLEEKLLSLSRASSNASISFQSSS